jgi:protein-serine/threonine kinase
MVCPDPAYRITAMQAYHHPALQLPAPTVIITPHFVRAATTFDEDEQPPIPYIEHQAPGALPKKKKKTQKTKEPGPRSATPTALGESIRQHTSTVKPVAVKAKGKGKEREESPKKGSKLVIKNTREQRYSDKRAIEEDITRKLFLSALSAPANMAATKVIKPAQELKIKEPPMLAAPVTS